MILLYNNSQITSIIMDREKNPNHDYINYIEIDEIAANKPIIKELLLAESLEPYTISNGKLFKNNVEAAITIDVDKSTLKTEYTTAVARLQQIETAASPTNPQVIQAIRDMARYQRLMLKILARLL